MERTWREPWVQARNSSCDQSKPVAGNMFEAAAAAQASSRPSKRDTNSTYQSHNSSTSDIGKKKRKAKPVAYTSTKKQKVTTEASEMTRNRWDKTEGFPPTALQPVFSASTRPLTNVERWRLRGWTWPEAMFRIKDNHEVRMESPRGTAFPSHPPLQLDR